MNELSEIEKLKTQVSKQAAELETKNEQLSVLLQLKEKRSVPNLKFPPTPDEFNAEIDRLEKLVFVKDGHIIIDADDEYEVELCRCSTYKDILGWVLHLGDKTWMTNEILGRLIGLALQQHRLKCPST